MNITHHIASLIPADMAPWITPILLLVLLLLAIVFFRPILQLLGVVIIPENKIGLVTKKFAFLVQRSVNNCAFGTVCAMIHSWLG